MEGGFLVFFFDMVDFNLGSNLDEFSFLAVTLCVDSFCSGLFKIVLMGLTFLIGLAFAIIVGVGSFLPFGYDPG